ncbi:hypothetical protein ACGF0J_08030 [Nonomuraea sp. NPDC047897]|uniref:hypothetical protein n=1 Tax=Nonomuraea sp. NPDC047897 TaxID=3364346 RepID=UPI00371ACD4B
MNGFYVERQPLHVQARVYDEFERNAREAKDDLRAAFDRDRNTLGNDEYGAQLAKFMPEIERAIFDALKAHIEELDRVASGLNVSARNYEGADQPSARRG